jgi:hypothetical protein
MSFNSDKRLVEQLRLREQLRKAEDEYSPRYMRARRFAQTVLALMGSFVPSDRETYRRMEEMLMLAGFESNAEIISVPPECDALDKLALERRMLERCLEPILVPRQAGVDAPANPAKPAR